MTQIPTNKQKKLCKPQNNIFSMHSLGTGWFVSKIKWKSFVQIRIKETKYIHRKKFLFILSLFQVEIFNRTLIIICYCHKNETRKKLLSGQFFSMHNSLLLFITIHCASTLSLILRIICSIALYFLWTSIFFLIFKVCNNHESVLIGYNATFILNLE